LRVEEDAVTAVIAELTEFFGPDRVLTGNDVLRQHGTDESWHPPATPDAVVLPRDTEEAARIVRACCDHKVPIVPFGAGTSLEGHIAALRGGISVDMREMNAILRLSVDDLDVAQEAAAEQKSFWKRERSFVRRRGSKDEDDAAEAEADVDPQIAQRLDLYAPGLFRAVAQGRRQRCRVLP